MIIIRVIIFSEIYLPFRKEEKLVQIISYFSSCNFILKWTLSSAGWILSKQASRGI